MEEVSITDKSVDEFLSTLEPEAKNWKPVDFRCMIQDILGNEIYNKHNSENLGDRTIFYCITIPGENEWVRNCPKGNKNEFMTTNKYNSADVLNCSHQNSQTSNQVESDIEKNAKLSFTLVNWSFPIPSNGKNRSCLIKVYDINLVESLRVNDIVHVSGLIEPNEFEDDSQLLTNKNSPTANGTDDSDQHSGSNNTATTHRILDNFEPASDFPHRLVPRVHVRKLKKLNHINPLLPDIITRDTLDITSIRLARARLTTILTTLLGGDSLTAEYLTLSLISRIHRRKDVTSLGQFTVGLSGIKPEMKFLVDKLYEVISRITTHSHLIDMSIANLNNLRFTPQKDHEHNKMIAGTLQLPDGLYLMINETALTEGQLTPQGTSNLSTLNHIIRWQRHNYDFKSYPVEIDTNLKVLVVSEGKSILAVPYNLRIEKNNEETIDAMRQACESVNDFLSEDLLNMFRYYITALKDVPEYTIPDDVQKSIQEDYCDWRKDNEAEGQALFSANDLSSYMNVARYLTISKGETVLTHELWKETCEMESARQSRRTEPCAEELGSFNWANVFLCWCTHDMKEHLRSYFPERFADVSFKDTSWLKYLDGIPRQRSKNNCELLVMEVFEKSNELKLLKGALKKYGCNFKLSRHVACEACNCAGGFDPDTNQIVICHNQRLTQNKVMSVLMHEMIHMFDFCRAKFDFSNLEHVACSEIRASNLSYCSLADKLQSSGPSNGWFTYKKAHKYCVKDVAFRSVQAYSPETDKEKIWDIIDKVFPYCYNDLEPFGRRPTNGTQDFRQSYRERFYYGYT